MSIDEKEIETVYNQYIGLLRRRAATIVRNPELAEDLAQETMMRFLEYRRKGGEPRDAGAFLYKTATNLAINYLRDHKNRLRLLDQKVAPALGQAATGSDAQSRDAIALRKALASVDEESAAIALYYYVDGMEQEEISSLLGIQRRTVGRRLERFRENARKVLEA